jgi:hypothetical protein
MTEQRSIQDVEKDISAVESTVGKLTKEGQKITDELTLGLEDSVLVEAALSGKSPATSARTTKMTARRTEIENMVRALENRLNRLRLEKVNLRSEALEAELAEASAAVMEKREAESQATAERQEAENVVAGMRDERWVLQDQRRNLENRLWENDAEFRAEAEAAAQQRRAEAEMTPEEVERYRRQIAEASGRIFYDSDEALAAMQDQAAEQGARLVPLHRPMKQVWPE